MVKVLMDIQEFETLVEKTVSLTLKRFQESKPKEPQYITRIEAAQLMDVCLSTLDKWGKQGKIKKHFLGKVVRYKKTDVLNALENLSKYQRG